MARFVLHRIDDLENYDNYPIHQRFVLHRIDDLENPQQACC